MWATEGRSIKKLCSYNSLRATLYNYVYLPQHVRALERHHLESVAAKTEASEASKEWSDITPNDQEETEDNICSDDDGLHYVNVDRSGLPLCRELPIIQLKYKGKEEVDVVKGHMYDRPQGPEHVQRTDLQEEYYPDQQRNELHRVSSTLAERQVDDSSRHTARDSETRFATDNPVTKTSPQRYRYSESTSDSKTTDQITSVASIINTMNSHTTQKARKPLPVPPRDISRTRKAPKPYYTNFGNLTISSVANESTTIGSPLAQNVRPLAPTGPSVAWQPGRRQSPSNTSQKASPSVDKRVKFVIVNQEQSPDSEVHPSYLLNKLM